MKESLFNIETEYIKLMDQIQEAEGEITDEMSEQLKINETQLQGKSIAYLEFIGSKETLNTRIDDEIKRLQAIKKSNNNLIKNLKERLLNAVKLFGDFEVGLTRFGTRKSSTTVVQDVNTLPKEYKVRKLTETADKKAIKEALQRGEKIEGCEIVENLNLKIN